MAGILSWFSCCSTTTVENFVPPKDTAPKFEQPLGIDDVHLLMLSYLTPKEVLKIGRVCRYWKALGQDVRLWNLFTQRLLPVHDTPTLNGFDLFKHNYIQRRDLNTETLVRYINQGDGANAEEFLDAIRICPRYLSHREVVGL